MNHGLIQALAVALPSLYLFLGVLYGMSFAGDREPPIQRARRALMLSTVALHACLFVVLADASGGFPRLDVWLSFSAVSLVMVALFSLVTLRQQQPTVAAIVFIAAFLLQLASGMFGPLRPLTERGPSSVTTVMHVLTVVLASAAVMLSGLYGFLYLLLFRQMRRQTFGALFRQLPDLRQLARMTRLSALTGFLGLLLGVNVGIGMAHSRGVEGFGYTDSFVLSMLAICFHFGLIAFSKRIPGITASRAGWAAVGGLTLLLGALVASALVPEASFHSLD
jgi:ABC-type uncharacterized transport system permease subunit